MFTPDLDPASEAARWAGPMGGKWLAQIDRFESMIAPIGAALLEAARFVPGEQVLDVGCGGGLTSIEIARRVSPGGAVTGLDVSPVLIERARERAVSAGAGNLAFKLGDAARAELAAGAYDCFFSRFGTMFFDDPYAAFVHLHSALKPSGRLALACWAPVAQNPWLVSVRAVIAKYVDMPPLPPRAPGQFAFEDPEYLGDILKKAGFGPYEFTLWQGEHSIGGVGSDPLSAARFFIDTPPVTELLSKRPETVRAALIAELSAVFARYHGPSGVRATGAAWLVTASA